MLRFSLALATTLLCGSVALAQTTPGTSTTSGNISGSGATTSGTAPASVGPAGQAPSQQYTREMSNNDATGTKQNRSGSSMKVKNMSPDGKKTKTRM